MHWKTFGTRVEASQRFTICTAGGITRMMEAMAKSAKSPQDEFLLRLYGYSVCYCIFFFMNLCRCKRPIYDFCPNYPRATATWLMEMYLRGRRRRFSTDILVQAEDKLYGLQHLLLAADKETWRINWFTSFKFFQLWIWLMIHLFFFITKPKR